MNRIDLKELEKGLNKEQKQAVFAQGPVLVLAGAGAGKTKTITTRIVRLISEGVSPNSILAITFTNKAAREMRERVESAMGTQGEEGGKPFVGTFHSFCVQTLRRYGTLLGIKRSFTILDRADSKQIVKEVLLELGMDPKQFEPGRILSAISREKGNMTTAHSLKEREGGDYGEELISRIWDAYEKRLNKEHSLDFDDLITKTVILLRTHEDARNEMQQRWKHILVDEYQDTNRAQYELVRLIAKSGENLFVVGDIDQTIYTWRGAHIKNLIHFEKDYPGTTVIILEENYRSTKTILDAANVIIKKNSVRYEKNLRANKPSGDLLGLYPAYDEADEASYIAHRAQELLRRGIKAGEIAVLYRANFQSRALEQAFLELKVPYQVLGTQFFERKEIKDIVAFIRYALNQTASGDLRRIINVPPRGLGKLALLKILSEKEQELPAGQRKKWEDFKILLERIKEVAHSKKASGVVKFVIEESKITQTLSEKNEEERERLENIKELVTVASSYDYLPPLQGIERMIEDVVLMSEQDGIKDTSNAVRLMTIHAAKGLEFDCVFITGLEQDLFPHVRSAETKSIEESEEERRLFYVALTRARNNIFLSYANVRTIFGMRSMTIPSEFITDLDDIFLRQETHPAHTLKTIEFD